MATTIPSTALVPVAPVFTNAERLALAGFLAGYSGLTRQAYELDLRQFASWCQQHQLHLFAARRADIEFFARNPEARGRARATITRRLCNGGRVLPVRRRRGAARSLTRRACAAATAGLRVPRHRPGPQRARRHARYRRAWPTSQARADLPARAERAPGLRSHRRQHRSARHRARPPHIGDHPQGRQGRHHPTRPTHRPGDRPGQRRTHRRADLPDSGQAPDRPARRRADRAANRPPRRDHQARRAPHTAPRVHHCGAGCRGATAGCPGGRLPC